MKKIFLAVAVYLLVIMFCIVAFNKFVIAEVPIKYDHKLCKMEIFDSDEEEYKHIRTARELIKQDVMAFCKDKYIYNIEIATDKGKFVYIIIYNDKE